MRISLESFLSSDFSPEEIRRLDVKPICRKDEAAGMSFEDALGIADRSCAVLPCDAAMRVASLLYLEAVSCGKERLACAVNKMLIERAVPLLHYETNSEVLLTAELFEELMKFGASAEDWDFAAASSSAANGIGWYVVLKAHEYMKTADVVTALNLEAIRGELGAFDDRLSSIARPFKGQIDCAFNVRSLVAGSRMTTDEGRFAFGYDTHPRVQDAICVRATPQTHGGARDVCYFAEDTVEKAILQGGSPYAVEYALNGLLTAVADIAHISERRTFRLNDSRLSYGLPMNLTHGDTGLNHGYPVVQSNQAAFVAELKLLVLPNSVIRETGKCTPYYAGVKLLRALPLFAKVMAIELLMTCQAMDIVQEKLPGFAFGKGTAAVRDKVRETIALMTENRFVSPDMNEADRLIVSGEVLKAAESAVGALR